MLFLTPIIYENIGKIEYKKHVVIMKFINGFNMISDIKIIKIETNSNKIKTKFWIYKSLSFEKK